MTINTDLNLEQAKNIAILGLTHIASDEDQLGKFLGLTGLNVEDLRQSIQEQAFLVAILDFFMSDEETLVEFAEAKKIDPAKVSIARQVIAGPEDIYEQFEA